MVEFTISIVVVLALVGIILQIGIVFYHYAALRYTAFKVIRELTYNVGSTRCGSTLVQSAVSRTNNLLRDALGLDSKEIVPSIDLYQDNSRCALSVVINDKVDCFFCFLLLDKIPLRVQQIQYISDECFSCTC